MKILVAGDWHSELHEKGVYQAFKELGHEAYRFSWHEYFKPESNRNCLLHVIESLSKRFQNKFIIGSIISKINAAFIRTVYEHQPDVIFLYRGTHIKPDTLRLIKKNLPTTVLVGYNNDDPFAENHPFWLWRHFLASIPEYDMILAYRHHNIEDFKRAGAKQVHLLRSWFIPWRNHPVTLSHEELEQFACDIVFVGHYEPDGRLGMLEEIVRQGFHLRLFGPGYDWDPVLRKSAVLRSLVPVKLVWGDEYNKALCGAKVALCFLSKMNRDTYTRRCFEIPATGTFMLSEYSDDLATLYKEGVEADFFRSREELIAKLKRYLEDETPRQSVAAAGYHRVISDGHDVVSRMKQVLEWINQSNIKT
ncbi:MAG: glycosyltransferase [Candidatus Methanoperedens sp.]